MARLQYKNIYDYKKETQRPPSKRYNPWKHVNKTENKAHENNFQALHDSLINISIKQQQKADVTLGVKTTDYSSLYGTKKISLEDGREITLRYVKIPTISKQNNPQYYVAFFLNMDYYSINDLKSLHAYCLNAVDIKTIEGYSAHGNQGRYTIYLSGKQVKRTKQIHWNKHCRTFHVFKINTITAKGKTRSYAEVRKNIFNTLDKLFTSKLDGLVKTIKDGWHYYKNQKMQHNLYGHIKEDVERLKDFLLQIRKTARYFWKIMMQLKKARQLEMQAKNDAEINDTSSKYSNNIRKQTEQYLNLLNMVEKESKNYEKSRKSRIPNEIRAFGV